MQTILLCLIIGFVTGVVSGVIGIGGGIILIPAMVVFFGASQHMAQGTTLALMVPPISLLAAWTYYKNGYVDLRISALICLGFFIGGLLGANIAVGVDELHLKKIFGFALLIISIRMILAK